MRHFANRKLKSVLAVAVVLLFALGLVFGALHLFLRVRAIEVTGNEQLTADAIIEASGIAVGQHWRSVDIDAAARAIWKLPAVRHCSVARASRRTIRICVEECVPRFAATVGDQIALFDESLHVTGYAAETGAYIPVTLPKVKSAVAGQEIAFSDGELPYVKEILSGLSEWKYSDRVTAIDMAREQDIRYTVDGIYTFLLGGRDELSVKLDVCAAMLESPTYAASKPMIGDLRNPKEPIARPVG